MQARKILIVDDDPDILDALKFVLEDAGYQVTTTEKGEYAENLRDTNGGLPDVIILDVMLPVKDGFTVCRELRQQKFSAPILMLTAKTQEAEKVMAFELGADDYVTKPFGTRELRARIKALLRRAQGCVLGKFVRCREHRRSKHGFRTRYFLRVGRPAGCGQERAADRVR